MKRAVLIGAVLVAITFMAGRKLVLEERSRQESRPILFASGKKEACLSCHEGIEEIHPKAPLYCTACHKGNSEATVKKAAHEGMIYNPAQLEVVEQTCGTCHKTIVDRVKRSIMATRSGTFSGVFYLNGFQKTKEKASFTFSKYEIAALPGHPILPETTDRLLPFPTYAETRNVLVDLMRKECMQCHLWTEGVQRKADYRGTGCAACHMTYDADGISQSGDPTISKKENGHPIKHVLTKKVPINTCATCHSGGNRIGLAFTGRMEQAARYDVLPQDLEHGHTYSDQIPDIHYEKGMVCIDCHTINEVHGDGNIYTKKNFQLEIRCETCHGTPDTYGSGVSAMGNPLPNIRIERPSEGAEGPVRLILTSKFDGKEHAIPQVRGVSTPKTVEAHQIEGHMKKMECYACHTAWVPKCMGCHIKLDLTKQPTPIHVSYDHLERKPSDFGLFTLMAGVREAERDYLLGVNHRGKITPFVPRSSVVYTLVEESGKEIFRLRPQTTAAGTLGFAHNTTIPHTVRKEVRECKSCHESRKALGLGDATAKKYPKLTGLMPDGFLWDRIVNEEGHPVQETSLEKARPLNKGEMDRIRRALKKENYPSKAKAEEPEKNSAEKKEDQGQAVSWKNQSRVSSR